MAQIERMDWDRLYKDKAATYEAYSSFKDEGKKALAELRRLTSFDGKRVLEVGCGSGMYTPDLASTTQHYFALDYSQGLLDIARSKYNGGNIDYICASVAEIPLPDESVDIVFSSWGYPPYGFEEQSEREIERVLKKGGDVWDITNYPAGEFMALRGKGEADIKKDRLSWFFEKGYLLAKRTEIRYCFPDYDTARFLLREAYGAEVDEYVNSHTDLNITRQVAILHRKKEGL